MLPVHAQRQHRLLRMFPPDASSGMTYPAAKVQNLPPSVQSWHKTRPFQKIG